MRNVPPLPSSEDSTSEISTVWACGYGAHQHFYKTSLKLCLRFFLVFIVHYNMYMLHFLCLSFIFLLTLFPPFSSHPCASLSLATIITSYLYLLLFILLSHHSSVQVLSCLFYLPLLFLIALWMSTASYGYPSPFLPLTFFFVLVPCPIPPSIRIYTTAGRQREEGRGETCATIRWRARMQRRRVNKRELLRVD